MSRTLKNLPFDVFALRQHLNNCATDKLRYYAICANRADLSTDLEYTAFHIGKAMERRNISVVKYESVDVDAKNLGSRFRYSSN